MIDAFKFITDFIRVNLIIGFGLYSIIFFSIKLFTKQKRWINQFDSSACKVAIFLGILFTVVWFIGVFSYYFNLKYGHEKVSSPQHISYKYWFEYFSQPIFWILLSQLLRIKLLRNNLIYRVLVSLMSILTFERIIIIVTSFKSDYLISSLFFDISFIDVIIGIIFKILTFISFTYAYNFGKKKLKTLLTIT